MSNTVHKLQRLVEKMEARYGQQDEDVLQLRAALESLRAMQRPPAERRHLGPSGPNFLSPAKQLYYASSIEPIQH